MVESYGYRDCAVILSSVDCMESMNGGILIQVLGELSNDGALSQKFAQTFFLASVPPSGYFVLNNIFRFLKEDVDTDYDDVEPDSGNETDTPLATVQRFSSVSDHLSNGFHHPTSPAPVNREDDLTSGPLEISIGPSPSGVETITSEHLTNNPQSTLPDDSKPIPELEPGFSIHEAGHSTEEPGNTEDNAPAKTEVWSEEQGLQSAAHTVAPESPIVKTWATMAASSPEKWGEKASDAKVLAAPSASTAKRPIAQAGPRKDPEKITHQGIVDQAGCTNLQSEKSEPALGYIKHVNQRVQKPALNDALVKFGQLRDLDINRQKVIPCFNSRSF